MCEGCVCGYGYGYGYGVMCPPWLCRSVGKGVALECLTACAFRLPKCLALSRNRSWWFVLLVWFGHHKAPPDFVMCGRFKALQRRQRQQILCVQEHLCTLCKSSLPTFSKMFVHDGNACWCRG